MKRMNGAVVLLSGGMDSSTLLHYVGKKLRVGEVHALSFVYGQKHSRELEMAKRQARAAGVVQHRIVDISFFGKMVKGGSALTDRSIAIPDLKTLSGRQRKQPPTYVPNRNMVLLSLAAAYAETKGIRDVFYGAQAQDEYGYWDCTVDFVGRMNDILRLNRRDGVTVHAPFACMSKVAVLKAGLKLGVDYGNTWTCYRGGHRPCGRCPTCVERAKAFHETGIADPLAEE